MLEAYDLQSCEVHHGDIDDNNINTSSIKHAHTHIVNNKSTSCSSWSCL